MSNDSLTNSYFEEKYSNNINGLPEENIAGSSCTCAHVQNMCFLEHIVLDNIIIGKTVWMNDPKFV